VLAVEVQLPHRLAGQRRIRADYRLDQAIGFAEVQLNRYGTQGGDSADYAARFGYPLALAGPDPALCLGILRERPLVLRRRQRPSDRE
jgi:hypothetical protein